jgi:hypothetical protein
MTIANMFAKLSDPAVVEKIIAVVKDARKK